MKLLRLYVYLETHIHRLLMCGTPLHFGKSKIKAIVVPTIQTPPTPPQTKNQRQIFLKHRIIKVDFGFINA